jgi:DNA-binding SARP family transcriptional activator
LATHENPSSGSSQKAISQLPSLKLLHNPAHLELADGTHVGGKIVALLAYLVLARPEGTSRDELMELLWDPEPGVESNQRMRQLLYDIKRALPSGVLVSTGRSVQVRRDGLDVDVLRFRQASTGGRLAEAAEIYQAELLTGIAPTRASLFTEWADATRLGLRRDLSAVLDAILDDADAGIDEPKLSALAHRRWELDPLDDDNASRWIDTLIQRGDPAGALEACQLVESAFADLGDPIPGTLRAVIGRARAASIQRRPAQPHALPAPSCVGRDHELQDFSRRLSTMLRTGRGEVLRLTGIPGIGKTRLLAEMEYMARYRDVMVWRSQCHEIESRTPYSAVIDLLGPMMGMPDVLERVTPEDRSWLGALVPIAGEEQARGVPGSGGTDRARLNRALASAVATLAEMQPSVVLLDDTQWSDRASLVAIHRIGLIAREIPLLIVLCSRIDSGRHSGEGRTHDYELAPLSRIQIGELLDSMAAFPEDILGFREDLVEFLGLGGGGIPLLLVELLSLLHEQGVLRVEDGSWLMTGAALPEHAASDPEIVRSALGRRLRLLPPDELAALGALSVIGRPTTAEGVAGVMGTPVHQVARWVERLLTTRILVDVEGDMVRFSHQEMAVVSLELLSPSVRLTFFRKALVAAAEKHLCNQGGPSVEALRLACGAAAAPEAAYFALCAIGESGDPMDILEPDLLDLVDAWTDDASVRGSVSSALEEARRRPRRVDRLLSKARGGLTLISRPARRHWAPLNAYVALAGMSLVTIGALVIGFGPSRPEGAEFGGGGTLILTSSDGTSRALRFLGGHLDTVSVPMPRLASMPEPFVASYPSPDQWLGLTQCPGEGPDDRVACIIDPESLETRLVAPTPGEDGARGWAPDGRSVLIASDRDRSAYFTWDLFVVDTATGSSLNVSNVPAMVEKAKWSPDGSRIAYVATGRTSDSLHIVTTTGRRVAGIEADGQLGEFAWAPDGAHLAFATLDGALPKVRVYETTGWAATKILSLPAHGSPTWAPDGSVLALVSFVATQSKTEGELVFLTGLQPGAPVLRSGRGTRYIRWWSDHPPSYLNDIRVTPSDIHLSEDGTGRISAVGWDQDEGQMRLPFLEYSSSDTVVAVVDPSGVVWGRSPGTAMVTLDAGGWRTIQVPVEVRALPEPTLLFEETWDTGIDTTRWKPYGDPSAAVLDAPGRGPAMINNGDSLYPSGVVTRRTFSPASGLALEWSQQAPLTGDQWQEVWVDLLDLSLDQFRAGSGEPYVGARSAGLGIRSPILNYQPPYPALSLNCRGPETRPVPFASAFPGSGWHDVAVQIYPTGGCSLIVDGRLVNRGLSIDRGWPPDIALRLAIGGRSHRTRILMDDIRVWSGVRWRVSVDGTVSINGNAR